MHRLDLEYLVSTSRAGELREGFARRRALTALNAEWLHVTTPLHLPVIKREQWVCSVQDVIAMDDPRYRQTGVKNTVAMRLLRRADRVIASSTFTAERVVVHTGLAADRITVIPLPVSDTFFADNNQTQADRPYALTMADVRTYDPRKRNRWIPSLAAALERADMDLVVIGWPENDPAARNLRAIGRVSDEEVAQWMSGAVGFVTMSQYEGQGLPPLEAMASGAPVVAFRNSATTEAVGVDEFLVDDPRAGEEHEPPVGVLQEVVERLRLFSSTPDKFRSLARARAQAYRPEVFSARVEQFAAGLVR